MTTQIADPLVEVNNVAIGVEPNSVKFTEGLGEQKIRAVSYGGGATGQVYSNNVETNFSKVMFEIPATVQNIALARSWKINRNQNVISITASTDDGDLTRVFTGAALLGDYENVLASEGNIALEFSANKAV